MLRARWMMKQWVSSEKVQEVLNVNRGGVFHHIMSKSYTKDRQILTLSMCHGGSICSSCLKHVVCILFCFLLPWIVRPSLSLWNYFISFGRFVVLRALFSYERLCFSFFLSLASPVVLLHFKEASCRLKKSLLQTSHGDPRLLSVYRF